MNDKRKDILDNQGVLLVGAGGPQYMPRIVVKNKSDKRSPELFFTYDDYIANDVKMKSLDPGVSDMTAIHTMPIGNEQEEIELNRRFKGSKKLEMYYFDKYNKKHSFIIIKELRAWNLKDICINIKSIDKYGVIIFENYQESGIDQLRKMGLTSIKEYKPSQIGRFITKYESYFHVAVIVMFVIALIRVFINVYEQIQGLN